jgi:glycosyltransferase involved in cell wall biosynthesis
MEAATKSLLSFRLSRLYSKLHKDMKGDRRLVEQKNPWVSIVIPCFNYGKFIDEAIDSCLASTFQDFEIIVVNDGSTDAETIEVLNHLNKEKTRVIHQANQGPAAARNRGIREARGKYIFPLDADDRIHPTLLEKGVWILETRPRVGVVTSWLQHFGESYEVWSPPPFNFYNLLFNNTIIGSSLYRKAAWEQVGGYDEKLVHGYEDWDFWIRMADQGWIAYQIPEPLFYYRKHGETRLSQLNSRHAELVQAIQDNHSHLYKEERLYQLKRQWTNTGNPDTLVQSWQHGPGAYSTKHIIPEKIRVLFVMSWLIVGGAEKIMLDLIKGLPKDRFHITLATTLSSESPWFNQFNEAVQDIFQLPHYFQKIEQFVPLLFHIIESRGIQVIHINNSEFGYTMLPNIKQRFPHIKTVAMLNAYVPELPWDHVRHSVKFDPYIDRYAVALDSLKGTLESLFRIAPHKIALIPNGVDYTLFSAGNAQEVAWIKNELQLPPNKQVVSMIGRLDADKDPLRFINIALRIVMLDPYDQIRFLVVGDGSLKQSFLTKAARYGLGSKMHFLGSRNDIWKILKITDVLVSTSPSEGLPTIGLEAMSASVPVVAFQVRGWQDLIYNGIDGFLIPRSQNEDAIFAFRVHALLRDTTLKVRMGAYARKKIVDRYSMQHFVSLYGDVYSQLLGLPTSPNSYSGNPIRVPNQSRAHPPNPTAYNQNTGRVEEQQNAQFTQDQIFRLTTRSLWDAVRKNRMYNVKKD